VNWEADIGLGHIEVSGGKTTVALPGLPFLRASLPRAVALGYERSAFQAWRVKRSRKETAEGRKTGTFAAVDEAVEANSAGRRCVRT
jgi:hypothetical protein